MEKSGKNNTGDSMVDLENIIDGCIQGDPVMQKRLYDRYSPRFFALCCRYAPDKDSAGDMLVEGFLTIFSSIGNYRSEGSFEGWMHTIFIRNIIKDFRRNKQHRMAMTIDNLEDIPLPHSDIVKQIDLRDALTQALRTLPEKERKVFNLVSVEGYTLSDVAEMMGKPESTIKSQYYKAKEMMRKQLKLTLGKNYLK